MTARNLISMRSRPLLLASLVIALGACRSDDADETGAGLIAWPDNRPIGAEPGDTAPNFGLSSPDGQSLEMASLIGTQPLVINFLATWCANCMEEMDILVNLHQGGVQVLGVNLREEPETVQRLIERTNAHFPILLDRTGKVTRAYKVTNLPATVVLTAEGRVSSVTRGPITAEAIREAVAAADGGV